MTHMLNILNFQNFDLLSVGIAGAAIAILGFVIYWSDRKSITNQSFLSFSFLTILYGVFNYINYQVTSPFLILWFLRLTIFFAVWHAFSLFQLFYVFPKEKIVFPRSYLKVLLPVTICTSLITLTPLVFKDISQTALSSGQVTNPDRGPGIALFGLLSMFLVFGGIFNIFKKTLRAKNLERQQFNFILLGTLLSFSLIITFNVILPLLFNILTFIPLAPVFILPFIAATAYSIAKYHLLNMKIIATEILMFILAIALLFEVILAQDVFTVIFRLGIFLLVLGAGILLIKSVRREVEQREQLQKLSSELADANERLKALDLARAEFISIASHQLRTPPATVKWYLSAIIHGDYGPLDPKVKEMMVKTERTNNLLISLIEDILNVSRIERGKMEFLFQKVNILELAHITYEQLVPLALEKHQTLQFTEPKNPLPELMADREKIRQVMNNMIDNAIKYTPHNGTITVSLSSTAEAVRFCVHDTGKGISPEDQKTIFQKYSRGKESIKQSAGLGLGLYVAKVIIEQHKGTIWAESTGVGTGSSFLFSLPLHTDLKETTFDFTKIKN